MIFCPNNHIMARINSELLASLSESRSFEETACSSDATTIYPLSRVYWAGETPICQVVIAESPSYGKVLFLDKEIQSAESDEAIYHEHLVHPVLAATAYTPRKRVLIVGGGEGATAREVLKWGSADVAAVDWVDIDGDLVGLCRRHLGWANDDVYNDPRLSYTAEDIRTFLARSPSRTYDVIILDLPDPDVDVLSIVPDAAGEVLLYSQEFMATIRDALRPHGAIVSHVGPIAPGGEPLDRRPGLEWMMRCCEAVGIGHGYPYHVTISSFQGDWGFWMSISPEEMPAYPPGLEIMNAETQRTAFTWNPYWFKRSYRGARDYRSVSYE